MKGDNMTNAEQSLIDLVMLIRTMQARGYCGHMRSWTQRAVRDH